METRMDMVMGGMQPKPSSRGRQRHWPYFLVVTQAKQGKHQKAKQPETHALILIIIIINAFTFLLPSVFISAEQFVRVNSVFLS